MAPGEARFIEPRLEPALAALRERLIEGGHSGEPFNVVLTNQEAEESVVWYLKRHPNIPFANPRVEIHQDTIEAWGEAKVAGLRVGLHGRARVVLQGGVPVVANPVGGLLEIVHPGETGFLAEQDDIASFVEHTLRLLGDDALGQAMGQRGRTLVKEQFSLERTVASYEALYGQVAKWR